MIHHLKKIIILVAILYLCVYSVYAIEDSEIIITDEPKILIISPYNNFLTNQPIITINGMADPYALLSLNRNSVYNNNGAFSENITLVEGLNQIFLYGQKGENTSRATINVTLDTISPDISIIPPENIYINTRSIKLNYTSNSTDLKMYRVSLNNASWHDTYNNYYVFNLTEGDAFIQVEAIDKAGNVGKTPINLIVDFTLPFLEITSPQSNDIITNDRVKLSGITEFDAIVSVNGFNIKNQNGIWETTVILTKGNDFFILESEDKAGNKAEKFFSITKGNKFNSTKVHFKKFSDRGKKLIRLSEGNNELISGKYVSYLYDNTSSSFSNYSINKFGRKIKWFDKVSISNFTSENISINGSVAEYSQNNRFGEHHYIGVQINDNALGTMLIDVRQFDDIFAKAREYLMNRPRDRLKINVSVDNNVTIEKISSGNKTIDKVQESWKEFPKVTYESPEDIIIIPTQDGAIIQKGDRQASIFRANYAGGTSNFTYYKNKIVAEVNYSLLIFRETKVNNSFDMLIQKAISDGIIGAEIDIDFMNSHNIVIFGNFTIDMKFPDTDTTEIHISSISENGTVLSMNLNSEMYERLLMEEIDIKYDGYKLRKADDYDDIMDYANDYGDAEYFLTIGNSGASILISIPHFSDHIIALSFEKPNSELGSIIFNIGWVVVFMGLYLVVRKIKAQM